MKVIKKMFVFIAMAGSFFVGSNAFAQGGNSASDTGTATASVIASLSLTNTADLAFGEGIQGDASLAVGPVTGGQFSVVGEGLRAYNITVPADGTVIMTTGAGGTNETIAVDTFSYWSNGASSGSSGLLNGPGLDTFGVGAVRAALGASQAPGSYTATYTVTIIYQ